MSATLPAAAEYKYQDRDLRDHPALYDLAVEYLKQYTGDFHFLRDAKRTVLTGLPLPMGVARGVLNCMRGDSRVTQQLYAIALPSPPAKDAVVLEMTRSKRTWRKKQRWNEKKCDLTESHGSHSWTNPDFDSNNDDEDYDVPVYWNCEGVPYEINRSSYTIDAKVKSDWGAARQGKFIHRLTREGHCVWHPRMHEDGFYSPPDLWVYTYCKYPTQIRDPRLFKSLPEQEDLEMMDIAECLRCKENAPPVQIDIPLFDPQSYQIAEVEKLVKNVPLVVFSEPRSL